jgi:hypothetical protein
LYGVVAAVGSTSLCTNLVLGFLSCLFLLRVGVWLDYCGQNLSKKGCLRFSPICGFPKINLVFFCLFFMLLLLFSTCYNC